MCSSAAASPWLMVAELNSIEFSLVQLGTNLGLAYIYIHTQTHAHTTAEHVSILIACGPL